MRGKKLNLSESSVRGRQTAIKSFADFLAVNTAQKMPAAQDMLDNLAAWQSVTAGMVEGYKWWLIEKRYRANTVNNRLGYIKRMARAAFDAGYLSTNSRIGIEDIEDVSDQQAHNIEKRRKALNLGSVSAKKTEYNLLSQEQCIALKTNHPDTPQGRRDRLMMCLFLADGLKIVDAIQLTVGNLETQILSDETRRAISGCASAGELSKNPQVQVLWSIRKGGALGHAGLTPRGCALRVEELGRKVGIERLTPSDCKNYFDNNVLTAEMEVRKLRKDNAELTAENVKLKLEIAALNSALKSKNYVSPRMPGAMDWSSADFEKGD